MQWRQGFEGGLGSVYPTSLARHTLLLWITRAIYCCSWLTIPHYILNTDSRYPTTPAELCSPYPTISHFCASA